MKLDLVKIVNKHVPEDQTFVFSDGAAYIFWEGVLFQYQCEAGLINGIYDRNLRLVKAVDRFKFPDLVRESWSHIGFPRLKDFCKVSPTGPDMLLCVEGADEEANLHLCSEGMAHNIPNRIHQFSADMVSRYLGLLRKNDESAIANFHAGPDGGVILVALGGHKIYFMTKQLVEKFRAEVARYSATVTYEETEDGEDNIYLQQPLALGV